MKTCCDSCLIGDRAHASVAALFGEPVCPPLGRFDLPNPHPFTGLARDVFEAARAFGNGELAALELEQDVDAEWDAYMRERGVA